MTDFQIIISPRAKCDLQEVHSYTLQTWGKKQADVYLSNIQNVFIRLLDTPKIGKERSEVRESFRSLNVEKHVVFYKVQETEIRILGVLHCRMDVMNYFTAD